jgi:hypothetical protein
VERSRDGKESIRKRREEKEVLQNKTMKMQYCTALLKINKSIV